MQSTKETQIICSKDPAACSVSIFVLFLAAAVDLLGPTAVLEAVEMAFPASALSQAFQSFQVAFVVALPDLSVLHRGVVQHQNSAAVSFDMPHFPALVALDSIGLAGLRNMASLVAPVAKLVSAFGVMVLAQTEHAGCLGFHVAVPGDVPLLSTSVAFLGFPLWGIIRILTHFLPLIAVLTLFQIKIPGHSGSRFAPLLLCLLVLSIQCILNQLVLFFHLLLKLFHLLLLLHFLHVFACVRHPLSQVVLGNVLGCILPCQFVPHQVPALIVADFHPIPTIFSFQQDRLGFGFGWQQVFLEAFEVNTMWMAAQLLLRLVCIGRRELCRRGGLGIV